MAHGGSVLTGMAITFCVVQDPGYLSRPLGKVMLEETNFQTKIESIPAKQKNCVKKANPFPDKLCSELFSTSSLDGVNDKTIEDILSKHKIKINEKALAQCL